MQLRHSIAQLMHSSVWPVCGMVELLCMPQEVFEDSRRIGKPERHYPEFKRLCGVTNVVFGTESL